MSIRELAANKSHFHQRRDLAHKRPDRARDKLHGYAVLRLKILRARGLPAADWNGKSDPYVEVYLDDVLKAKTPVVKMSLDPEWNWEVEVSIKTPLSVIRLQVLDYDFGSEIAGSDDFLGFVEIPVAELSLGSSARGWFILSPKQKLTGTSSQRLKALEAGLPMEESCGALDLEVTLTAVSGHESDELYAWCLPGPECRTYPEEGFTRKSLDMQNFMDKVMDLKAEVLGSFVRPVLAFISYLLTWRESRLSLLALAAALLASVRPELCMTALLGMSGLALLSLRDPKLRIATTAHPGSVPLSDKGYKVIAELQSTQSTAAFLLRVISSIQGRVLDQDRLREFAAFATHEGMPVTTYAQLKLQLREAAGLDDPFLSCRDEPLKEGALVKRGIQNGEISKCLNPKECTAWRYVVRLHDTGLEEEVAADELSARTDVRWMGNSTVLALIPDSVEDTIMGYVPTLDGMLQKLRRLSATIDDVVSWRDAHKSLSISLGCIALSLLFAWVQRLAFAATSLLMFAMSTPVWMRCTTSYTGAMAQKRGKRKLLAARPFFKGNGTADVSSAEGKSVVGSAPSLDHADEALEVEPTLKTLVCCAPSRR